MEMLVIIALIATLCLFDKFEDKADAWLESEYETKTDKDSLKTHFAFYGFSYWMGALVLLCVATLMQLLTAASAGYNVFYALAQGTILVVTILYCSKAAKIYYRCAEASEKKFKEYIASK